MPKQVRLRRGTTAQHATFTGADGEVTVDTTKRILVLHDGVTAGGKPLDYLVLTPTSLLTLQTLAGRLTISGGDDDNEGLRVDKWANILGDLAVDGDTVLKRLVHYQTELSHAATVQLHFDHSTDPNFRNLTLAGNVTFTTAGLGGGRTYILRIRSDGVTRTLTFPGWKFVGGAAPANIAANKTALLRLWSFGGTDADVVAHYEVEP